jgi:hypothetical protein
VGRVLTLLTQTPKDVEQYLGHRKAVLLAPSVMAKVGDCQADTEGASRHGHCQPQAVAKGGDVAVPGHVGAVGYLYKYLNTETHKD